MSMKSSDFHKKKIYNDSRTKQAFKDETDINKILAKAQRAGSISHLEKYEGFYGDFASFDFSEAQRVLANGNTIFNELPPEIRIDFEQSPAKFFEFVNRPENRGELRKIFPEIAKPGRFFPDVSSSPNELLEPTGAVVTAEPAGGAGMEPAGDVQPADGS